MLPFHIERLQGVLPRLKEKILGISDEVLSTCVAGKWSIKQNIGHLSELDIVSGARIQEIIHGTRVMSPAVFEPKEDYNAQSIATVVRTFEISRTESIARYRNLNFSELEKSSLHPRLNVKMTPVDLALFEAEHDDHHLVRISEILAVLSK